MSAYLCYEDGTQVYIEMVDAESVSAHLGQYDWKLLNVKLPDDDFIDDATAPFRAILEATKTKPLFSKDLHVAMTESMGAPGGCSTPSDTITVAGHNAADCYKKAVGQRGAAVCKASSTTARRSEPSPGLLGAPQLPSRRPPPVP